jgi:hypothetical protein
LQLAKLTEQYQALQQKYAQAMDEISALRKAQLQNQEGMIEKWLLQGDIDMPLAAH